MESGVVIFPDTGRIYEVAGCSERGCKVAFKADPSDQSFSFDHTLDYVHRSIKLWRGRDPEAASGKALRAWYTEWVRKPHAWHDRIQAKASAHL